MIEDSVRYLKEQGKEVIYDAEHFFDGYTRTIQNMPFQLLPLQKKEVLTF